MRNIPIALFLFFAQMTLAQTELSLSADTNHIRLGEQIELTIKVSSPTSESMEITWPILADTLTKSIEVIHIDPVDTLLSEGFNSYFQTWTVTSFDSGFHQIPPFDLTVNGTEFKTDPLEIKVETMPVDTTQAIKQIKGVEGVDISLLDWIKHHWEWFAGLAVLTLLILGLYQLLKSRKKRAPVPLESQDPEIEPFELAIKRLNELREAKYWQKDDVKKHHAALSEILRDYLEKQFAFPALEQTTAEVMNALRYTEIKKEQQQRLRKILMLADLVKFAKEKPESEENIEMLNQAIAFVESNRSMTETDPQPKESKNET